MEQLGDPLGSKGSEGSETFARSNENDDAVQPGFFDVPRARWSNPSTSRAAAESISMTRVSTLQRAILNTLRLSASPLSDEEIVERVQRWRNDSEQSVRTRRCELVRQGRVALAGTGTTSRGRKCGTWTVQEDMHQQSTGEEPLCTRFSQNSSVSTVGASLLTTTTSMGRRPNERDG